MDRFDAELEVKIKELIAETGLSRIYKASLGLFSDIKIIVKMPQEGKETNLEKAIKIYKILGYHKNLQEYIGEKTIDGKPVLLLKYFNGQNIIDKIDEIKGDFNKILKVLYQFLDVVDHIKSRGVFYLDEFIRNVMVDENLFLKLGDFNFSETNMEIIKIRTDQDIKPKDGITIATMEDHTKLILLPQMISSSDEAQQKRIEKYKKTDLVHIGDFIYFLFTGQTTKIRYNQPVQEANKKLKKELLTEVDEIVKKLWEGNEDIKISDIIKEFKNLEQKYRDNWRATKITSSINKEIKKSKGVKESINIEYYKKLVLDDPFNRKNHEALVRLLLEKDKILEGINFYSHSLKSNSVYSYLSLLYLLIKSPEEERIGFLGEVGEIVFLLKLEENSKLFQELKDDFYSKKEFLYPELHQHIGFSIAEVFIEEKQFEEALKIYNTLLRDGFGDIYLFYKKGSLLEKMDRLNDALESYKRGIEVYPEVFIPNIIGKELNENLIRIAEKVERLEEVKEFCEELINKQPNPILYFALIKILKINKEYGELERVCREAIDKYPEVSEFYGELGVLLSSEFRRKEALIMLEKAFKNDPSNVIVSKELAKIYMMEGEDSKAKETLETTLIYNSKNPELYYMLARVAMDTNDFESAEDYLKKSINLGIKDKEVYYEYGSILLRNKKLDEAIKLYNKMKELFPDDIRVYEGLKDIYFRKGDPNKIYEVDKEIRELKAKKFKETSKKLEEFGKKIKKFIDDL